MHIGKYIQFSLLVKVFVVRKIVKFMNLFGIELTAYIWVAEGAAISYFSLQRFYLKFQT